MCVLISEWSEMVRQFLQELNRDIERSGRVPLWVGCTEIQPGRFDDFGQPCPHLHLAYVGRDSDYGQWFVSADRMRLVWKRIIDARIKSVFDEEVDFLWTRAINCQGVKKDASAYLSKYLSKGGDIIEKMKEEGYSSLIPSSWWHCCTKLKNAIRSLVCEVPSDIKLAIKQGVDLVERGVAIYLLDVVIGDTKYGWVGKLKRKSTIDKNVLDCC